MCLMSDAEAAGEPRSYNAEMRTRVSARSVLPRALVFFAVLEGLVLGMPIGTDSISMYAAWGIQRERFPLSTVSPWDNALDVGNLDAMFAAHVVSNPREPDEFRVLVLGDSTIWGLQYTAEEVLPGRLNGLGLRCGEKAMRFYNLSFPRSSATKDLMILDHALRTKPDAIIWLVTWYTLMPKTRVDHWMVTQNPAEYRALALRYDFLPRNAEEPTFWEDIFDRNRRLFRTIRFQLYTLVDLATGRDQIPGPPQIPATELSADETFEGMKPPTLRKEQVSLDQVADFHDLAGSVPVMLINEPILIMQGIVNSNIRYNSYYPRWVYDQYREHLARAAMTNGWNYVDLWDIFPARDFADTPLHLVPSAHRILAETLAPKIEAMCR